MQAHKNVCKENENLLSRIDFQKLYKRDWLSRGLVQVHHPPKVLLVSVLVTELSTVNLRMAGSIYSCTNSSHLWLLILPRYNMPGMYFLSDGCVIAW